MSALLRLAEFQAAWWATALLAGAGFGLGAAVPPLLYVLLHIARSPRRSSSTLLVLTASALGVAVDHGLLRAGIITFAPEVLVGPSPPFMVGLWAAFACTFETSLAGLVRRPALAAVLGAIGGVVSYNGAASLGVLAVGSDVVLTQSALAVVWAAATPALGAVTGALSSTTANRRARSIPLVAGLAMVCTAAAPLLFLAALGVDLVRAAWLKRPFMSLRVLAFGYVYLLAEVVGVAALALIALLPPSALVSRTYRVQERWTSVLLAAVGRIFRLRFDVDGDALVRPGPVIVLVRHASIIDTLLPSVFLTQRHGVRLRFVLKQELLADPCLDIAGSRLPNHFTARSRENTERDLEAIRSLARGMQGRTTEGTLIYPEGTRFSPTKRARNIEALAAQAPEFVHDAQAMTHVLPPKPAGVCALLDGAPDADVLVVAHTGLEGFGRVSDIWSGAQLGKTVRIKAWRVPRGNIPNDDNERARWLYAQWRILNDWVDSAMKQEDERMGEAR